jgi:hypothetical protein
MRGSCCSFKIGHRLNKTLCTCKSTTPFKKNSLLKIFDKYNTKYKNGAKIQTCFQKGYYDKLKSNSIMSLSENKFLKNTSYLFTFT